ncbi:thioredoxin [Candidatus Velamenicoccus archaeovorus]|uniref:Thioredoxin n=1 Tax=Velamenicoccus archaeovorus TaxID=1930593 RepID=A0A410P370_VELA1|nr:thioredoxin [Candidatus Velamenicoccus archaeovorus]QAT16606.1 thioredoxin [Candidatus Velamenicoccus archaeovorus]
MGAIHLSDENFKKEVLESKIPCLVDFWAEWCGPCRRVAPVVEEIADEFQGRFKVAKLNVDEGSKTASAYGVMSIPTLMFFKDGKVVEQVVGAVAKQELVAKIEELLG